MKKVFNVFLMSCLLATSMFFMAGCGKDKDDNDGGNLNNTTWKTGTVIEGYLKGVYTLKFTNTNAVTFSWEGRDFYGPSSFSFAGTYTKNGSTVTMKIYGTYSGTLIYIGTINGGIMEFVSDDCDDCEPVVFIKQ